MNRIGRSIWSAPLGGRVTPRVMLVSGANRLDSKLFEKQKRVEAIPAIAGLSGHPCKRPLKRHADKSCNFTRRWLAERAHGWFAGIDKLRIRFERRLDINSTAEICGSGHLHVLRGSVEFATPRR